MNTKDEVVGLYSVGSTEEGFSWTAAGGYKAIQFPGNNNFTRALGINNSGEIVGDFLSKKDGFYHGFTDIAGKLKQYDVPGGLGNFNTSLFAIATNGNLAGAADGQGFVSIGGAVTMFYGSGTDLTYTNGINSSGEAVGQFFDSSNLTHGFTWVGGVVTEVDYPGATQTALEGINDSGVITGYYVDSLGIDHGFMLTSGVFTTSDLWFIEGINSNGSYVGNYPGPGVPDSIAYGYLATPVAFKPTSVKVAGAESTSTIGINNAGILVGQYTNTKGTFGMMLNGTTVTKIDYPGAVAGTTFCYSINNNNEVVGYYTNSTTNVQEGFYWAGGAFTNITGPPGSLTAVAYGINDAGQITGTFEDSSGATHGFVLSGPNGTYTQLDVPGATATYAWGINSAGTIVLGWVDASGFNEASLLSGSTYTNIDLPGTYNMYPHSINTAGDVIYTWEDGDGLYHGGLLSGGAYYLLDVPGGTNAHGDGINDSGIMVGRYNPSGSTNYEGFKGTI